jgi:hypothetical protein
MSVGSVCRHLKIIGRVAIFTILSRCPQGPVEVATHTLKLRNWAVHPDDAVLALEEIARRILRRIRPE